MCLDLPRVDPAGGPPFRRIVSVIAGRPAAKGDKAGVRGSRLPSRIPKGQSPRDQGVVRCRGTCLLAALSVHDGEVTARGEGKNDQVTFLAFLKDTPTYASWLNQVEVFFNIFTREVMRGGVWRSKKELVDQAMYHIKCDNETATPFAWSHTGKPLTV